MERGSGFFVDRSNAGVTGRRGLDLAGCRRRSMLCRITAVFRFDRPGRVRSSPFLPVFDSRENPKAFQRKHRLKTCAA